MFRVIAAVLAVGILAACDNGPTGPTTFGGEVTLETGSHLRHSYLSYGEGYNFVRGQRIKISRNDELEGRLGTLSDMDLWGGRIYAKPQRIYLDNGEQVDRLSLRVGESATFTLRALKDKARCRITIKYVSSEWISDEWRINKFFMRFKIEIY